MRFRVAQAEPGAGRPHGIKYAFTLHDVDRARLLGFDNARGVPRVQAYDHRHRFRRTSELVAYEFRGADELISVTSYPAGPLLAALSAEALELMSVVLERHPASVGEVVRLTGRSQPNVSRSLQQLAGHGFVRLVRTGREVRPEALVRSLQVDLATGTYRTEPAPASVPA